jgi:hypothetical protein
MFNPKYNLKTISKSLSQYEFIRARDGTTVTLYYFDNKWCMSSSNGYEINTYLWMGPLSYEAAFKDVATKYPEFSFDRLDKSKCYTIGFRHNDFHPLLTDPSSAWFIQSVDLNTLVVSFDESIGLPFQEKVKITNSDQFYKELHELRESLNNYVHSARGNGANPTIRYGLILRGKFETRGSSANVFLESELMKRIRQLMYNLPKEKTTKMTIDNNNRLEYSILRAYLNYTSARYTFINLFPQYASQYEKYSNIINKLVTRIVQSYRNKNVHAVVVKKMNGSGSNTNNNNEDKTSSYIDKLTSAFIEHLNQNERVNAFDPQSKNIIHDYIVDPKYIDLYFGIIAAK